jgi:hypothetical protein
VNGTAAAGNGIIDDLPITDTTQQVIQIGNLIGGVLLSQFSRWLNGLIFRNENDISPSITTIEQRFAEKIGLKTLLTRGKVRTLEKITLSPTADPDITWELSDHVVIYPPPKITDFFTKHGINVTFTHHFIDANGYYIVGYVQKYNTQFIEKRKMKSLPIAIIVNLYNSKQYVIYNNNTGWSDTLSYTLSSPHTKAIQTQIIANKDSELGFEAKEYFKKYKPPSTFERTSSKLIGYSRPVGINLINLIGREKPPTGYTLLPGSPDSPDSSSTPGSPDSRTSSTIPTIRRRTPPRPRDDRV